MATRARVKEEDHWQTQEDEAKEERRGGPPKEEKRREERKAARKDGAKEAGERATKANVTDVDRSGIRPGNAAV